VLLPHLNERQQRLAVGTEARLLGHGGVRAVADAAKVSASTVRRAWPSWSPVRIPVRWDGSGGPAGDASGRPTTTPIWLRLVEPDERGDPMSALRWTTKSLRHLAEGLTGQGHPVSAPTVGVLLKENGFSLQGTAKTLEGAQHPDRDLQFRYINEQVKAHQDAGEPVISVDAKKKDQLGQLPAAGSAARGVSRSGWRITAFSPPDRTWLSLTASTTWPPMPAG
jgi:Rhodopirellula transposase DDE domain